MPDANDLLLKEDFHNWLLDRSDEAVDELDVRPMTLGQWVTAYFRELRKIQVEEDGSEAVYEESEFAGED